MPFDKKIQLLLELDDICDQAETEAGLVLQLVEYLAEMVDAGLGAFSLPDEFEDSAWKLQAVADRRALLKKIGLPALTQLAERAVKDAEGGGKNYVYEVLLSGEQNIDGVAIPQMIENETLGVLLLLRKDRKFTPDELDLLAIASTRIDSALRFSRTRLALAREKLALETIRRVDLIRDTSETLDELLSRSLAEVIGVVDAQVGFIMLYDRQGNRLELRAVIGQEFLGGEQAFGLLYEFADQAIEQEELVHHANPEGELRAILGMPLILNERIVGVLGVVNPNDSANFTYYDRQLLAAIGSQMDTAIFERMETQRIREVFGRNVGARVMHRLLQISDRDILRGERVEMTVLFSDIRGFTQASGRIDPTALERMIDAHLSAMVDVIFKNEGTLDKFMGDGVMAFFNAPDRQPDHAERAVRTALEMQAAHRQVMQAWESEKLGQLPIGIGIASGEAIVGSFGSRAYAEYSAIGSTVNLAARLCEDALGGQVLVNRALYEVIKDKFRLNTLPDKTLKGFGLPVPVWEVEAGE